jgi:hypothetical protein
MQDEKNKATIANFHGVLIDFATANFHKKNFFLAS